MRAEGPVSTLAKDIASTRLEFVTGDGREYGSMIELLYMVLG
jgi:hypothetical protein